MTFPNSLISKNLTVIIYVNTASHLINSFRRKGNTFFSAETNPFFISCIIKESGTSGGFCNGSLLGAFFSFSVGEYSPGFGVELTDDFTVTDACLSFFSQGMNYLQRRFSCSFCRNV
jgi:hypothetical protein